MQISTAAHKTMTMTNSHDLEGSNHGLAGSTFCRAGLVVAAGAVEEVAAGDVWAALDAAATSIDSHTINNQDIRRQTGLTRWSSFNQLHIRPGNRNPLARL